MDRASASEAGNVGSTPAERKLKSPALCGVFYLSREHTPCGVCVRESKGAALYEFCRRQRRVPRARPAGKFRQEFYRKATTAEQRKVFKFMLGVSKLLCLRRKSKAGALCEFEFLQGKNERRAWRGGAASAERQQGDLWPTT